MKTSKSFSDDGCLDSFDEDLSPVLCQVFSGTGTCVRAFHRIVSYLIFADVLHYTGC